MVLRLLSLYPDQMNIYADRGNLLFIRRRCEWRGIGFELATAGSGESFDPGAHDLIYMGGGQDRDQRAVARDLIETKRDSLLAAHRDGTVILTVCGGYQLLGERCELEGETIPGVGLADLVTVREDGPRLVGPAAIEVNLDGAARTVAGFENHAGRTWLGTDATAFGRVLDGHGNNGSDGLEGVRSGNLIGTYLHGPLLPKNAWLADHLIRLALEQRSSQPVELEPLDDRLEDAAHRTALAAADRG